MKSIKTFFICVIFLSNFIACNYKANTDIRLTPFADIADDNTTLMSEYGHSPYNTSVRLTIN